MLPNGPHLRKPLCILWSLSGTSFDPSVPSSELFYLKTSGLSCASSSEESSGDISIPSCLWACQQLPPNFRPSVLSPLESKNCFFVSPCSDLRHFGGIALSQDAPKKKGKKVSWQRSSHKASAVPLLLLAHGAYTDIVHTICACVRT